MLTQAQIGQYQTEGFVVPDFRLSDSLLDDIAAAHTQLVRRHPDVRDYCSAVLAFDTWFLNIARIPEILDMVCQLLGDDVALWNSSFFAKPARVGTKTPWHQDGEYWPIRPLATCTVWIAIDKTTTENGCLRVIPRSHHAKVEALSPREVPLQPFPEESLLEEGIDPGRVVDHDNNP